MVRILTLAVLVFLGASGAAHAATLDVTLGLLSTDISYNAAGAALNPNIHLNNPAPNNLVLNNNALIIDPRHTSPDNFRNLQGNVFDNNYLAVLGTGNPGLATFTLEPEQYKLGFTWGTIDLWNSLTITDSRAVVYTFTGANILAQIGNPAPGKPHTQTDIRFFTAFGDIVTAQFASSQNSFEAGNFSESAGTSAVPLPAALPLFGTALMALFGFVRQRNLTKA